MQNLLEAKQILNGIDYWLDCGTLLFAVRNNAQDPADDDIAIMAIDTHLVVKRLPLFIKRGFRIHRIYHHPDMGITEFSFRRNNRAFDIFVYYPKGKYLYAVSWYDRHIFRRLPSFETTKGYELNDSLFPVPENPEKYLLSYYGEDWRIPKVDWNPVSDPPCNCDENSFFN